MKSPPRPIERAKKPYRLKPQLPPLQTSMIRNLDTYIDQSIAILDEAEKMRQINPHARMKIDGGFGDHCLALFRKKDQVKRQQDIPRLFTQTFRKRLNSYFPSNIDKELDEIIERNKTIDVVGRSSMENKQQQRKIPPFMVDLDGHLNYSFDRTVERQWVRSKMPSPTKSLKLTSAQQIDSPEISSYKSVKNGRLNVLRLPAKLKN